MTITSVLVGTGILAWTAVRPQYGSFLSGAGRIMFGACWMGVICSLRIEESEDEESTVLHSDTPSRQTTGTPSGGRSAKGVSDFTGTGSQFGY